VAVNQQSIDAELDKVIKNAESDIDKTFATRLKTILNQIANMYQKYSNEDGQLTWTDMNKYSRFQQEMSLIASQMTEQYQYLLTGLQSMMENIYLQDFMKSSYLYELAAQSAMAASIPSLSVIQAAVKNPIPKLTLPSLMESHRNDIVNRINLEMSQSLIAGESYAQMATRIQKAVGFSKSKARNVAVTEGGRVQTQARLDSAEKAKKHANLVPVWLSTLDMKTRPDHRKLDGQDADEKGYFHIHGLKAKGPHLWGVASQDCRCRCTVIMKVNGKLPDTRNARDYQDAAYQQKLADRIDKYMEDGMTEKQAEKQAKKEIKAPNVTIPFKPYDEWLTGKKKAAPKQGPTIKMPDDSERAAVIDNSSGIPIIQPVDLDTSLQTLSVDDVKEYINQVPKEHQGVIKEIHLLDMYDQEGNTVFNNASGGYGLETKNIEMYRNDWLNRDTRDKTLAGIVRHETAHALQETLGDQFLKDWKKAAKKDAAHITDYAKTDIYEDVAETISYHWSPDSIERRTVEMFFPERYSVLKKYGIKSGHDLGNDNDDEKPKLLADISIAKTDMKEKVGEDNYNKFAEHLNGMQDERIRSLFEKYADQMEFKQLKNETAYTNGSIVQLAQVDFDGDKVDNPLQTVYHEIGHAFDNIGLRTITGKSLYPTGNKIKAKHNKKTIEISEYVSVMSAMPKYKLRETINRDLWEYVNGKDLPMVEDLGERPRKRAERAEWNDKAYSILNKSKANFEKFEKEITKKYSRDSNEISILSDIYESTPFTLRDNPLGSGHGKTYYNKAGHAEAEFFAHVAESIAASQESYVLLNEIFPNAVKTWENIVDDMLKAGD
jgi:SPP1 gp7 family putative phage head morphogenesis protein